jgi:hypothetical protein
MGITLSYTSKLTTYLMLVYNSFYDFGERARGTSRRVSYFEPFFVPLNVNAGEQEHTEGLQCMLIQGVGRKLCSAIWPLSSIFNACSYVTIERAKTRLEKERSCSDCGLWLQASNR